MKITSYSVMAVLAVVNLGVAELNKPILQPALDLDGTMETQLRSILPKHTPKVTQWAPGTLPSACKTEALSQGFKPADMIVLNVTYDDCSLPWVVCRHKNSPVSQADLLTRFGQIPVGMRQWVQNLITVPETPDIAYSVGAYTVICGNWANVGTLAHEFTHIMDLVALTDYVNQPYADLFSSQKRWQDPQARDLAVPTWYAATAWVENFAEAGRVALSDMVVSGGLASINKNASQVANQISVFEQYSKGIMFPPGKTCTTRIISTDPVPVSGSIVPIVPASNAAPTADVDGVSVIELPRNITYRKFVNPQKPAPRI